MPADTPIAADPSPAPHEGHGVGATTDGTPPHAKPPHAKPSHAKPSFGTQTKDSPPFCSAYGDVYHPTSGAWRQAREVFLSGNGLPARWRQGDAFCILETGFGLGNNFLATWASWLEDPQRCDRLRFISVEKHPLSRDDLARLHGVEGLDIAPSETADSAGLDLNPNWLAPHEDLRHDHDWGQEWERRWRVKLAHALLKRWPPLTPGWHLLEFPLPASEAHTRQQRVQLMLGLGDVARLVPGLIARVDAFFLDGFSPARNPQMWDPAWMGRLDRLANAGATAATWSVARPVRDALTQAGFVVQRVPGAADKRQICAAQFQARHLSRPPPGGLGQRPPPAARHALIIGSGLAGAAAAMSLHQRGWTLCVLDQGAHVASAASGNAGGLFHSIVHAGDGVHARTHRAAALATHARVSPWMAQGLLQGQCNGLLRLEPRLHERQAQALLQACQAQAHVSWLSQAQASHLAGLPLPSAAWLFHQGGWLNPAEYAKAMLAQAGLPQASVGPITAAGGLHLRQHVQRIARDAHGMWCAFDEHDTPIARAPSLVLANGWDALRLLASLPPQQAVAPVPMQATRGQVTQVSADFAQGLGAKLRLPRLPIAGSGYAIALSHQELLCGASSQADDWEAQARLGEHLDNLRMAQGLAAWHAEHEPSEADLRRALEGSPPSSLGLRGRVGWRAVTPDRLPVVGALPLHPLRLMAMQAPRCEQVRMVPRERSEAGGLYLLSGLGSRGITWAALAGELLAHWMDADACPVEAELRDALDPARFVARAWRKPGGPAQLSGSPHP